MKYFHIISSDIKELTNFVKARQQEIQGHPDKIEQVAGKVVDTLGSSSPVLDRIEKLPYFVSLGITDAITKLRPSYLTLLDQLKLAKLMIQKIVLIHHLNN